MRKLLLTFPLLLLFSFPLLAATTTIDSSGTLRSVTIFRENALVTKEITARIPAGSSTISISGLPSSMQDATLRITPKGKTDLKIADIEIAATLLSEKYSARLQGLQGKIDTLATRQRELADESSVLKASADIIKRTAPTPSSKGFAAELDEYLKYAERVLTAKYAALADIDEKLKQITKEKELLEQELKNLATNKQKTKTVNFGITTKGETDATVELSYVTTEAGWAPRYELRADTATGKVEITYSASIAQSTGEDWSKVPLELSTTRPAAGQMPVLSPWFVDIYPKSNVRFSAFMPKIAIAPSPLAEMAEDAAEDEPELHEDDISFSFLLPARTVIPSDGEIHTITLLTAVKDAELSYAAVPRYSPFAFLQSSIQNPFPLPMLAGDAQIYLDNRFTNSMSLGKGILPEEAFAVAFGVDESIKVERKLVKRFTETTGVFSGSSKVGYQYELTVVNGKKKQVSVMLHDALPISRNEKVEVAITGLPTSDALLDSDKMLKWNAAVSAGGKQVLKYGYSVEHPKDERVSGLE